MGPSVWCNLGWSGGKPPLSPVPVIWFGGPTESVASYTQECREAKNNKSLDKNESREIHYPSTRDFAYASGLE